MTRLSIRLTPELEKAISDYMKLKNIRSKSVAIRLAVQEAVEVEKQRRVFPDFSRWIGLALTAPLNPHPRFQSDDDL